MNGEAASLRRLLERLNAGASLVPTRAGAYRLMLIGSDTGAPGTTVSADVVSGLLSRGVLSVSGSGGRFHLTEAGRALICRLVSPDSPYLSQHGTVSSTRINNDTSVAVQKRDSPLAWLHARKGPDRKPLLSQTQFEAGNRLHEAYYSAGYKPAVGMRWSDTPNASRRKNGGRSSADPSDRIIDARRRYRDAIEHVGPELSPILVHVCCEERGLGEFEAECGLPRRSGKVILQLGLDRLAGHFGLTIQAAPNGGAGFRTSVRHWGSDGYRPSVDGG